MVMLLRSDFFYELPERLIAKYPADRRTHSRLLVLDGPGGRMEDRHFYDLPDCLKAGDLLVFNDTKVMPARLYGRKETGGALEILIERVTGERTALALVRSSKAPRPGTRIVLDGGYGAVTRGREGDLFDLEFTGAENVFRIMDAIGHVPLPPYIDRADGAFDRERYQTVYSRVPGAVAAPTAGLHFDEELLAEIRKRGVETGFVTLHVGAGTFQPVKEDDVSRHRMHSEHAVVPAELADRIAACKARGGRVVAVGTTSVRSLESAAQKARAEGKLIGPFAGSTDIFIYPGRGFLVTDALVTNFHLPESTLIMLVCAFAGYRRAMAAYRHAVESEYRFFSYGDAMFITRNDAAENADEIARLNGR